MTKIYQSLFTLGITFILCEVTLGQAPNIGSDSSFALFTTVGAFGNAGTTVIWGDVGTNAGAYKGSQTVFGAVHVEDSVSAKAALDLQIAYAYMVGLPCDSTIISPFGGGLVLIPQRVYCLASASALNGNLILDAKNNPNGIFIIKVNGALSTSINSNVILQNAASACNVYWQVGGAVDLGINATFKGTILADGAINLLDSAFLEGRGLTRAGAISLLNNKVVGCDASGISLPIDLMSFTAQPIGSTIELNWSTASELNNDYYTIQRSNGTDSFSELLRVQGSGNSNIIHYYTAFDEQPFYGNIFYRLQQTDFDGISKFSNVIVVNFKNSFPYSIYPNPFSATLSVVIDDILQNNNNCNLKIYNALGKEMMSAILTERITILETGNLLTGMYFYKIFNNLEIIQSGHLFSIQ
jgi:hypothetical protein